MTDPKRDYGRATTTLYTIAQIHDIADQLMRQAMTSERQRRGRVGYLLFRLRLVIERWLS